MISKNDLDNRAVGMGDADPERLPDERPYRGRGRGAVPEASGPSLAERLASAKTLTAPAGACRACYQAGRDAVVGLLSRADDARPIAARIAEAGTLRPVHDHAGDPAFAQGRDAAVAAVRVIAGEG